MHLFRLSLVVNEILNFNIARKIRIYVGQFFLSFEKATLYFRVYYLIPDNNSKGNYNQGTKIFKSCTSPAGRMTYNFHSFCKHVNLSFKSTCNKEHKGVICNMTFSSNSFQSTHPAGGVL